MPRKYSATLSLAICALSLLASRFTLSPVFAQNPSLDVANMYAVADPQAKNGDIMFYSDKGLVRADSSYSNKIFGVLQDKPILVYRTNEDLGQPVIRSGTAYVNVSDVNGSIKNGDYITSSVNSGKGQKAVISGYVLGTALADLAGNEGQIPMAIRIEYVELTNTRSVLRLLDAFNVAAFQGGQDPDKASQLVKYIASGLIIITSFFISFFFFARSIGKSIEAIGRNPLAKKTIMLSILINASLTIVTIFFGIAASYIILQL